MPLMALPYTNVPRNADVPGKYSKANCALLHFFIGQEIRYASDKALSIDIIAPTLVESWGQQQCTRNCNIFSTHLHDVLFPLRFILERVLENVH